MTATPSIHGPDGLGRFDWRALRRFPIARAPAPLRSPVQLVAIRAFWVAASVLALGLTAAAEPPVTDPPARIGFSRSMFRSMNENDVNASLRTYAATLARDAHIPVAPNPVLFDGVAALRTLLREEAVDTVSLAVDEYFSLEDDRLAGPLLIALVDGQLTEEYILVVHRESRFTRVADLQGQRILLLDTIRTSIAPQWLAVLLAAEGLGPPRTFFGAMSSVAKPARVALPVFFHQEEACVTTRRGLAVLGELNPQVADQLRVLATSPKIVPALTCFRANYPRAQAARVSTAVAQSHLWPAGKQIMAIFQCDRVEAQPDSLLAPTRELLASYRRLHPPEGAVPARPSAPPDKGGPP